MSQDMHVSGAKYRREERWLGIYLPMMFKLGTLDSL